jgi:hypothetical protein
VNVHSRDPGDLALAARSGGGETVTEQLIDLLTQPVHGVPRLVTRQCHDSFLQIVDGAPDKRAVPLLCDIAGGNA